MPRSVVKVATSNHQQTSPIQFSIHRLRGGPVESRRLEEPQVVLIHGSRGGIMGLLIGGTQLLFSQQLS
jgi:hypothetical protein